MCKQNLQKYLPKSGEEGCSVECCWLDLAKPSNVLKNVDYIVMNPPFHEGKSTDVSLGVSFIMRAYESLRKNGALWMVANKHLAYERVLKNNFRVVHKQYEGQGFTFYEAVK